jgi:hypothetical protein
VPTTFCLFRGACVENAVLSRRLPVLLCANRGVAIRVAVSPVDQDG